MVNNEDIKLILLDLFQFHKVKCGCNEIEPKILVTIFNKLKIILTTEEFEMIYKV